jgi:hypothetical protein
MAEVIAFPTGGYRYIKGVFQYSAGVAAEPGFEIERVRFRRPLPLAEGFRVVEAQVRGMGRPLTAFCACELRSPAPFTEEGFTAFNRVYVGTLERWGLYRGGLNPVARSNVCPAVSPPSEPSLHAFSYTVPAEDDIVASFVVAAAAGAGGMGGYRDHIVRRGGTRPRACSSALGARRDGAPDGALGFAWRDTTATQLYTVHDVHPFLADEIVRRGAAAGGLTWHFCRPPVVELDYEMDVRGVARELVL